jgi:hypothetical protein
MSAGGLDANPPEGISRDAERHGPPSEVALAGEHERNVTALRQALIEGENSGEADDLDLGKIKAKARQRPGS